MDAERFLRLKAIVSDAAERPRPDRAAFLESACGEDAELRREAESLLAHGETLPPILAPDGLEDHLAAALQDAMKPDTTPPRIGPYTIHEVLGEGGMGIVYGATQDA